MNIVLIHTHDTGRFIQPYGYAVSTPNLMRFARESLLFRHAYCAGPTCSPSRAALMTGMVPHSAGMFGLAHLGRRAGRLRQAFGPILKRPWLRNGAVRHTA
ncbi:sulfatase-like hydrolase/transferase [Gordoniibacillus kamchatkensis]|uniref:sulfatase-like hydrolase/transferase n=1 Tax=Gordoniibacillus kamchatkensis TaxID=1590651 RepID=UPI0009E5E412|nr:sulfatase-like hydrolase/transferase [Paenibacillus sp. VKM B-2647]